MNSSESLDNARDKELKKVKDEVLALTLSPLYAERVKNKYFPVIGEGSHSAEVMFIGEAPGENEAKTGRPFCGRAGKVLDELLASVGIDQCRQRPPARQSRSFSR